MGDVGWVPRAHAVEESNDTFNYVLSESMSSMTEAEGVEKVVNNDHDEFAQTLSMESVFMDAMPEQISSDHSGIEVTRTRSVKINSVPEHISPPNASRIAADLALLPNPVTTKRPVWSVVSENDDDFARMTPRREWTNATDIEQKCVVEPIEKLEEKMEDEIAYVAARKARRAARKASKNKDDHNCTGDACEDEEAAARRARKAARKVA